MPWMLAVTVTPSTPLHPKVIQGSHTPRRSSKGDPGRSHTQEQESINNSLSTHTRGGHPEVTQGGHTQTRSFEGDPGRSHTNAVI
jgi:hypothetical protein